MNFLSDQRANSTVEWIIVVVIIITVLGSILLEINQSLAEKLRQYHDAL
jgi:heme/copper-type cytochrome/quinol oxidase subunit 4